MPIYGPNRSGPKMPEVSSLSASFFAAGGAADSRRAGAVLLLAGGGDGGGASQAVGSGGGDRCRGAVDAGGAGGNGGGGGVVAVGGGAGKNGSGGVSGGGAAGSSGLTSDGVSGGGAGSSGVCSGSAAIAHALGTASPHAAAAVTTIHPALESLDPVPRVFDACRAFGRMTSLVATHGEPVHSASPNLRQICGHAPVDSTRNQERRQERDA